MSDQTVYLVSGAGRGLGLGLVKSIVARANTVVFAGVRDVENAKELQAFADEHRERVFVVKLTSANKEDNERAARFILEKTGKLDVVIANAGINAGAEVVSTAPSVFEEVFRVNSLGPLVLFQTMHSLLTKSTAPSFVIMSSALGSLAGPLFGPNTAYGMSKAAANFIMKGINLEHAKDGLVTFSIHPGFVATDMGNGGARGVGLEAAPISVQESSAAVLGHIDSRTNGGKFVNWKSANEHFWDLEGDIIPW